MRPALAALLLASLAACGDDAPPPEALASPLATVEAAFGPAVFDVTARARRFTAAAADQLLLARRIEPSRYRRLPVTEIRRLDAERRAASVAFAVDGWPLRLDIELARGLDSWTVVGLPPVERQQEWLDLLGPEGLPRAAHAEPWRGGLAGRDGDGRPTAQVVVTALRGALLVDGEPVSETPEAVIDALLKGLQIRHRLAEAVHTTASPEVVLALGAGERASRAGRLARWATTAGAQGLRLAVRGPQPGPATLPLARRGPQPRGLPPPVITLRRSAEAVELHLGDAREALPLSPAGILAAGALGPVIQRLRAARPVGGNLVVEPDLDLRRVVALIDAWHGEAGGLPLALDPEAR